MAGTRGVQLRGTERSVAYYLEEEGRDQFYTQNKTQQKVPECTEN